MKKFKTYLRYASPFALYGTATVAMADSPITTILAAADLTTVAAFVGTIGVVIVGIAIGFKGIDLSKRGVKKA